MAKGNWTTTDYFDEQLAEGLIFTPAVPLAEYRFDEGAGTALIDHGGGGLDGLLGGGLGAGFYPTWGPLGLQFFYQKQVSIPAAALNGARTVLAFVIPDEPGQTWQQSILSADFSGNPYDFALTRPDNRPGLYAHFMYGDSIFSLGQPVKNLKCAVCWTDDGGIYLDGAPIPSRAPFAHGFPAALPWTGAATVMIGAHYFSALSPFVGKICWLSTYAARLSDLQIAEESARIKAIVAARGLAGAGYSLSLSNPLIAFTGDSMTRGYTATYSKDCFAEKSLSLLTGTYDYCNLAVSGDACEEMLTYSEQIDALLALGPGPRALVYMIGTNAGFTADEVNRCHSFYLARKAAGWDKVVGVTGLPRYVDDLPRQTFNSLFRSIAGHKWDNLADWGADANMGQAGQYLDGTYYTDALHPNTTGHAVGAGYVAAALAAAGFA